VLEAEADFAVIGEAHDGGAVCFVEQLTPTVCFSTDDAVERADALPLS